MLAKERMDDLGREGEFVLTVVPTTIGTGAEQTSYATYWDFKKGQKYSVGSEQCKADYIALIPVLLEELNYENRVNGVLDAMCQLLDSALSKRSSKRSQEFCLETLDRYLGDIEGVVKGKWSLSEWKAMGEFATRSGQAIEMTNTSLTHVVTYGLTAKHGVAHGLACAFTLEWMLKDALENGSETFRRFVEPRHTRFLQVLEMANVKKRVRGQVGSLNNAKKASEGCENNQRVKNYYRR